MYTSSIRNSIKIVIWDLDDTIFNGILAEEPSVAIKDGVKEIIIELSKRGIINSICSFNDYEMAKNKLIDLGLWEYFVFPQISYRVKSESIEKLLADIHLLPSNALFIDNDERQLAQVKQKFDEINLLNAQYYKTILDNNHLQGNEDNTLKRLKQYKMMEAREQESQKYTSDNDFLMSLSLSIRIEKCSSEEETRVNSLVNRAHQLNYASSLDCDLSNGYCVYAWDKLGDMGLVGYYNIQDNKLKCFVFSCRVINLGIEQWVYSYLGCPELDENENVAIRLKKTYELQPHISLKTGKKFLEQISNEKTLPKCLQNTISMYLYGACDMHRCSSVLDLPGIDLSLDYNVYFKDYRTLNAGSEYIRECFEHTNEEKRFLKEHFSNYTGEDVFNLKIKEKKYDVAIFSFSDDAMSYLYHHRDNEKFKIIGENHYGMPRVYAKNNDELATMRKSNWVKKCFVEEGFISEQRFRENLMYIRSLLASETLIILFEIPECGEAKRGEKQKKDLFSQIQMVNSVMKQFCENKANNAVFLHTTGIVDTPNGYSDYFLHWNFSTCKEIAEQVLEIVNINIHQKKLSDKNIDLTIISNDYTGELVKKLYQIAGARVTLLDVADKPKNEVEQLLNKSSNQDNTFLLNTTGNYYETNKTVFSLKRAFKREKNKFVPMLYSYSFILKDFKGFKNDCLNGICKFESIYIPLYLCTLCQVQTNLELQKLNPYGMDLKEYFDLAKDVKHISYRECAEFLVLDNVTVFSKMKIVEIDGVSYTKSDAFVNSVFYQEALLNDRAVEKDVTSFTDTDWEKSIKQFSESVKKVYGNKVIFIEPKYVGAKDVLYDLYVKTNKMLKSSLECYTITADTSIYRTENDMRISYDSNKIENEIEKLIKEKFNV